MYDLIIIGAGPAGLALAQCCVHINKKILIIDRESTIGGCHRVRRVNYKNEKLFTEHGPRIYSETYTVFISLLKEMNVNFYDLFVKYKFNIGDIGNQTIFSTLSSSELAKLAYEFIILLFNESHGTNTSMYEFLNANNFKEDSIEIINRLCKLTDGGDITKYTLNKFLQLANQQNFHPLYQPNMPNDKGLFKIWYNYLTKNKAEFLLDTKVSKINIDNNLIKSISITNRSGQQKELYAGKYIFAIPPANLNEIILSNKLKHNWSDFDQFVKDTKYVTYICVTFHWNTQLKLKKLYGFPRSYWGVAYIILSDYMQFDELNSKTVMSVAVTIPDVIAPRINKTANQCTQKELFNEIYLQLKDAFGEDLSIPTASILSPGITYDGNLYDSIDTAFISSSKQGFINFKNDMIPNMYTLGTHNGKSLYKFTSLESAVTNAVVLSKILYPELNNKKYIKISRSTSISDIFHVILVLVVLIIIVYLTKKYKYYNI